MDSDTDSDYIKRSYWSQQVKHQESHKYEHPQESHNSSKKRKQKSIYNVSSRLYEYLLTSNLGKFESTIPLQELLSLFKTSLAFRETLLCLLKLSHYVNGGINNDGSFNVSEKFLTYFIDSLSCETTKCTVSEKSLKNVINNNVSKTNKEDIKKVESLKNKVLYDYKISKQVSHMYKKGVPLK